VVHIHQKTSRVKQTAQWQASWAGMGHARSALALSSLDAGANGRLPNLSRPNQQAEPRTHMTAQNQLDTSVISDP